EAGVVGAVKAGVAGADVEQERLRLVQASLVHVHERERALRRDGSGVVRAVAGAHAGEGLLEERLGLLEAALPEEGPRQAPLGERAHARVERRRGDGERLTGEGLGLLVAEL